MRERQWGSESLGFLYAEEADASQGEVAVIPGFRIVFTRRGLPDLVPDRDHAAPGVVIDRAPLPPPDPFEPGRCHAVLVGRSGPGAVVSVLLRRQRAGGEPRSPATELMRQVRESAERCGFPFAWVVEGLPLSRVDAAFGHGVGARVRSVADRVSRGMM